MNRLLTPKAVCEQCAVSRATLDRMVAAGTFPAPVRITERRLAFSASAVANWINTKLEAA